MHDHEWAILFMCRMPFCLNHVVCSPFSPFQGSMTFDLDWSRYLSRLVGKQCGFRTGPTQTGLYSQEDG